MDNLIHGISGSISGMAAVVVWYPLDILRMKVQVVDLNKKEQEQIDSDEKTRCENDISSNECGTLTNMFNYLKNKFSTFQFLVDLLESGKVLTLYNGISSAVVGAAISYGVYFFSYQLFKNLFVKYNIDKGVAINSFI